VIKIRYSDQPAGMHASAEREGTNTVLSLRPGLSPEERRNAIDRLRSSARVGHGPGLPVIPLALALTADRIRLTLRNTVAAARLHPTGFAIPVILIATGAILYGLLVTVTIHFGPPAVPTIAQAPLSIATRPVSTGESGPPSASPSAGRAIDPPAVHMPLAEIAQDPRAGHGVSTPPGPTVGSKPSPSATPNPGGSVPPTSPPPPSSSPSPSPSPTSSHGHGGSGLCLNLLDLIGICVNL
jgi:hypothetical protein